IDSFYKENVEELNELIANLKEWENKYSELNNKYQILEKKLNDEIVPEIEMQKNLVMERKNYYDELKQDNDFQIQNFDKKIELMKNSLETQKLEIIQKNQTKIATKEAEYFKERTDYTKQKDDERQKLLEEIEVLKKEKEAKIKKLGSTEEMDAAELQMGYEMNTIKSKNLITLHQESEKLAVINEDLKKEIENISNNIHIKLTPMGVNLKRQIETETLSLNKIIKKRIKKIEESVVVAKQYEQMQMKYNELQTQLSLYDKKIRDTNDSIQYHKDQLQEKEMERRTLHNELQDLRGNIRVFCRIRPEKNPQFIMKEVNNVCDKFVSSPQKTKNNDTSNNSTIFSFDRIFDETASNNDVFDEVSQLVQSSLDGYKVCIFAYGQTGSGKTFTMLNPDDGIIPSTLRHIYSWIDNLKPLGWEYKIKIQFVEIYNENIIDLFADKKNAQQQSNNNKKIEIRHLDGKTTLTNVEQIDITHSTNAELILRNAMKIRATAATKENDHSSRSHSIFTISLNGHNKITSKACEGVLNLIDLAGSERLNKSQATGDRLKETKAINKSLSCLGDVIHSLSSCSNLKTSHIPFRNSKLTYMLQNYLTGDGKTLMFVNVSSRSYVETINSLRFSSKVNNTKM
ncbi:kinesin-domain-containing protein, partial [Hanseniaspora valbyensis NRRL Y-1626]